MSQQPAIEKPRVSRMRVTVLACIVIGIIAALGWNTRSFFRLNHVDYLLNQREFDKGLALLDEFGAAVGESPRAKMLRAKALTLVGSYDKAIASAESAMRDGDSNAAQAIYWKALSEFQSGQTTTSRETATRFLATGENLPNGTISIVKALAGQSVLTDIPEPNTAPFRMMFDIEQATYLALVAMEVAEVGHFDLAARVYERAFLLGNRNAESLLNAALVSVLVGDVHGAEMYMDYAGVGSAKILLTELERRYRRAGRARLTLQGEDISPGQRRVDVARALAWMGSYLGAKAGDEMERATGRLADLYQNYSTDPVIRLWQADALVADGKTSAAMDIYRELQKTDPTLATQLRMLNAGNAGSRFDVGESLMPFIEKLGPLAVWKPRNADEGMTSAIPESEIEKISGKKTISGDIDVESRGSYLLSIVARGEREAGEWPLVYVRVNGANVGVCYIASSAWDLYSVKIPLEPGRHHLELSLLSEPDNDGETVAVKGDLQWALAIVTGLGAREAE